MDVNYNMRIDKQLRDNFKQIAQENAHNPSALVRKFMQDYINKNKGEIVMDKGYGTVKFEGKEYTLEEMPEIDGTHEAPYYSSLASDGKGEEYRVKFEITHPDEENLEDKSDACDWETPFDVEKI